MYPFAFDSIWGYTKRSIKPTRGSDLGTRTSALSVQLQKEDIEAEFEARRHRIIGVAPSRLTNAWSERGMNKVPESKVSARVVDAGR